MSHRSHQRLLATGFTSLLLLAAPATWAEGDVLAEIEAANKVLEGVISRSDGPGMAAHYTENAQVLAPQAEIVTGPEAIGKFWQGVFDSGVKGATLTTLEVEDLGGTVNEVGNLEIRGADGQVLDQAKYIVIWKKDGGAWKLHRDIWNSSVAPAAE